MHAIIAQSRADQIVPVVEPAQSRQKEMIPRRQRRQPRVHRLTAQKAQPDVRLQIEQRERHHEAQRDQTRSPHRDEPSVALDSNHRSHALV
jgi:hypothetical protein